MAANRRRLAREGERSGQRRGADHPEDHRRSRTVRRIDVALCYRLVGCCAGLLTVNCNATSTGVCTVQGSRDGTDELIELDLPEGRVRFALDRAAAPLPARCGSRCRWRCLCLVRCSTRCRVGPSWCAGGRSATRRGGGRAPPRAGPAVMGFAPRISGGWCHSLGRFKLDTVSGSGLLRWTHSSTRSKWYTVVRDPTGPTYLRWRSRRGVVPPKVSQRVRIRAKPQETGKAALTVNRRGVSDRRHGRDRRARGSTRRNPKGMRGSTRGGRCSSPGQTPEDARVVRRGRYRLGRGRSRCRDGVARRRGSMYSQVGTKRGR